MKSNLCHPKADNKRQFIGFAVNEITEKKREVLSCARIYWKKIIRIRTQKKIMWKNEL